MEYFLPMRTALLIGVAALAPVFFSGQAIEVPDPVKAQQAKLVMIVDREGAGFRPIGTGFLLFRHGTAFAITNDHVVRAAKGTPWVATIDKKVHESQSIVRDEAYDLAILRLGGDVYTTDEIEERVGVATIGLQVYAYGFPEEEAIMGPDPVLSVGRVFWIGQIAYPHLNMPAFRATGLICRHGASGGPVFNAEGAIVGYVKAYNVSPDDCVCIPFQHVEDLIDSKEGSEPHEESGATGKLHSQSVSIPRVKGSANTIGLLQCRADSAVSDCTSAVTDAIGVATAVSVDAIEVQGRGVATVAFASASPSAGWYACATTLTSGTHNITVQSERCVAGEQVGILTRGGISITEAPVLLQFK
jgi:S1-C subfamily serine protease